MKIMTELISSLEYQKIMGKQIANSNVGFQIPYKLMDKFPIIAHLSEPC
jgi:hypothetical protein